MNVLLTEREHQVVEAMLSYPDLPRAAIAEALGITPKTMDIHVSHIRRKTGYRTMCGLLVELVQYLYAQEAAREAYGDSQAEVPR